MADKTCSRFAATELLPSVSLSGCRPAHSLLFAFDLKACVTNANSKLFDFNVGVELELIVVPFQVRLIADWLSTTIGYCIGKSIRNALNNARCAVHSAKTSLQAFAVVQYSASTKPPIAKCQLPSSMPLRRRLIPNHQLSVRQTYPRKLHRCALIKCFQWADCNRRSDDPRRL